MGENLLMLMSLIFLVAGVKSDWCRFNVTASDQDIVGPEQPSAKPFIFRADVIYEVRVHIDLVEDRDDSRWIDYVWGLNGERGRHSFYGDVVWRRKHLEGLGSNFTFKFVKGYNIDAPVKLLVELLVGDDASCTRARLTSQNKADEGKQRQKRSMRAPVWVDLEEGESDFCWIWPIYSAYGVNTIALASGSQIFGNHEYVQLSTHESRYSALFVPGIAIAGPNYVLSTDGGHFYQGRSLFKYSRRDAAWVLWDYEKGKPTWNGDRGPDYWKYRTCAVPATQPGMVFQQKEE